MIPTQPSQLTNHTRPDLLALGLLLLGFGLRTYHLGHQSLWYDEGFSVYLAGQSLAAITTGDFLPPLYHYLLHFWLPVAGRSEFAVRFLSLAFGVLLLALAYRLAARFFDRSTGRAAVLLTGLAPFHIGFSQEARMYALVTFLGLLSGYSLLEALASEEKSGRKRWWVIYAVATAAAFYTHYYAFLLPAAQGAYVLWVALRHRSHRPLFDWAIALAGVVVLFLPWTPLLQDHIRQQNASYWPGVLSLEFIASRTLFAFTTGQLLDAQVAQAVEFGYALLVIAGIISNPKSQIPNPKSQIQHSVLFLLFYLLIPFTLMYLIVHERAKFSARYLLIAWPAFALLAARGLRACLPIGDSETSGRGDTGLALARSEGTRGLPLREAKGRGAGKTISASPRLRVSLSLVRAGLAALALVFVFGSSAQAADRLYHDPRYGKDDYRALAAYLNSQVQPGEAILLLSGHIFPVFSYYYRGDNWYPIPAHTTPSPATDDPLTFDIVRELSTITAGRSGVWVVLWQEDVADPNGVLITLLDWNYHIQRVNARFRGLGLRHYTILPGEQLPDPLPWQPAPELSLASEVVLRSFILGTDPARAGDKIEIILNWQALVHPSTIYKVSLRLIGSIGQIAAVADNRLAGFWYPSDRWKPGELVAARHILPVPAGTPPGQYRLDLVVYREGDIAELGSVTLSPMRVIGAQ